ncbi:GSCOCG00008898001-RA-CDS [Cotesia congregata]|nr:GSCOCG00008898001-RA-CDS [Cotesia congregata]
MSLADQIDEQVKRYNAYNTRFDSNATVFDAKDFLLIMNIKVGLNEFKLGPVKLGEQCKESMDKDYRCMVQLWTHVYEFMKVCNKKFADSTMRLIWNSRI